MTDKGGSRGETKRRFDTRRKVLEKNVKTEEDEDKEKEF